MGGQDFHHRSLALLHQGEGVIQPFGPGGAGHRCGKQHTAAQASGEDQHIARGEGTLGPVAFWRHQAVGAQAHGQARLWLDAIAGLHGVTAQQAGLERLQHRLHAGQGLVQQVHLQVWRRFWQGDQRQHAVHSGTAGPEIAAGMQGGEPAV